MGHKILIIDDDEDIADNVQILLSYEGFDVIKADNVDEGLIKIKTENPELVLLDLMFPESKTLGFEAALDIKKLRPDLPVFVFSALNRESALEFYNGDVQFEEFMLKPVDSKILIEQIRKYLD